MQDTAPLPLLFEDADYIAVNKPAGLLSIPGRDLSEGSALECLNHAFPSRKHWVVHRIDRETSGVLLFAKSEEAHRTANQWFSSHEVKKEYVALASGKPRLPAFRINHPIEGKPSLSQVQVIERYSSSFLARVRIATGRRHQIRLHLQAEGFSILGDERYGGLKECGDASFQRVALHAERLVLPGARGEIVAPMPVDFLGWIETLKKE
jgi:23S rRNA pseudouridine1911/1915/1917 synthase